MIRRKIINYCIVIVFGGLCIFGIIYSLYNIIGWKKNVDDNNYIKQKIDKSINITIEEEKIKSDIDWDSLKKQNSDTIAYIKVNNTNIDYIVVKGNDNDYYLKHNFNKEYNVAGWIFADYHNKFDDTDKNIVIYGHNTKDNSMFGSLKNILNKEWYEKEENKEVILITPNNTYYYEVFSIYSILAEDYYINTIFNNENEFVTFANKIKSRSIHNYDIELRENDKILTLSSCIGDGSKRVVLHAKLIEK